MAITNFYERLKALLKDQKEDGSLTEQEKQELIESLATAMKNEKIDEWLGHYPIQQPDDVDNNSNGLYSVFQRLIDLDGQKLSESDENYILKYIENIINEEGSGRDQNWNESIKELINYFRAHFRPYSQGNEIKVNGSGYEYNAVTKTYTAKTFSKLFSIAEAILKANAGYSFKNSPWVMPNINIDEQSYDNVRGADKINNVLKSQKNMDFTHTQTTGDKDSEGKQLDDGNQVTKYIRLLMPRYTRRVEVEDLNRNFWVIGQVLTAVCAYLFDDDSPIMNMFKRLLNENVQIWENLLYLWAAVSLLGEKDYVPYNDENIHYEVVYVPNDEYNREFKFDGYDLNSPNSLDDCLRRVKYIADQYPNKHVCLLPVVRKNNYYRNYYSKEIYYGVLFYDRNAEEGHEWIKENFNGNNGYTISCMEEDNTGNNCLYYIKENNGKYKYTYNSSSEDATNYIQALRSRVSLFKWNSENESGKKAELKVTVEDAARSVSRIFSGADQRILTAFYHKNGGLIENNLEKINDATFWNYPDGAAADAISSANKGLYLCELITNMKGPGGDTPIDPTTYNGAFTLVKIGDFYPDAVKTDNSHNFVKITTETGSNTNRFDLATYGRGSYYFNRTANQASEGYSQGSMSFRKYTNNNDNNNKNATSSNWLTPAPTRSTLKEIGREYVEELGRKNELGTIMFGQKFILCATKIGVAYWTGSNGSQWNNGIVLDLIVYDIEKQEASVIGEFNYFDGYWTRDTDVFSNQSGQWRELHMSVKNKGLIKKVVGGKTVYEITDGLIQWYDHNKTISGTTQNNVPECEFTMRYNQQLDTNVFNFGTENNHGLTNNSMKVKLNRDFLKNNYNQNNNKNCYISISNSYWPYYNFSPSYTTPLSANCVGLHDFGHFYIPLP